MSAAPTPREEHRDRLLRLCQSGLERRWVELLDRLGLRLPSDAQVLIENCGVRPDFLYQDEGVAIFVDGPHHDEPAQQAKDFEQQDALEDLGFNVIRFHHAADWEPILARYPQLLGTPTSRSERDPSPEASDEPDAFDPEDYDEQWQEPLARLASEHGVIVAPGDGAQPTADAVATSLLEQGHRVLRVKHDQDGLIEAILTALEG